MQTLWLLSSVLSVEIGKWVPPVSFRLPGFSGGSDGKESASSGDDLGSVPGLERSLGEGNGSPIQYSCLEKAMDSRAWQAIGYGVTKSWIQLSDYHTVPLNPWQVLKGSNFQNLASHVKND